MKEILSEGLKLMQKLVKMLAPIASEPASPVFPVHRTDMYDTSVSRLDDTETERRCVRQMLEEFQDISRHNVDIG
jgi:hypothetical protein